MDRMRIEDDDAAGWELREPLVVGIEARRIREERAESRAIVQSGKKSVAMAAAGSGMDKYGSNCAGRGVERMMGHEGSPSRRVMSWWAKPFSRHSRHRLMA